LEISACIQAAKTWWNMCTSWSQPLKLGAQICARNVSSFLSELAFFLIADICTRP
jgi:hypothetical protein